MTKKKRTLWNYPLEGSSKGSERIILPLKVLTFCHKDEYTFMTKKKREPYGIIFEGGHRRGSERIILPLKVLTFYYKDEYTFMTKKKREPYGIIFEGKRVHC